MTLAKDRRAYPPVQMKDAGGGSVSFHPNESEITEIDISKGYTPTSKQALATGFWICPLVSGTIKVRLLHQRDTSRSLPIPTERVDANIGQWMDEKCIEILASGTTVARALIAWVE